MVLARPGMARQYQMAPVGGRHMEVDPQDGGELLDDGASIACSAAGMQGSESPRTFECRPSPRPFDDHRRVVERTVTTPIVSIVITAAPVNACARAPLTPPSDDDGAM